MAPVRWGVEEAMGKREFALGIDVGGTNIKAVAIDARGRELRREGVSTPSVGREPLIAAVRMVARRLDGGDARWIGLCSPGLAARDGRSIVWMQGRMEAVQGLDWTGALASKRTVWVLNDAHAATVGEAWLGAARERRHAVLLTLGTGIGGGILVDGRLLQGTIGRAGHLGHLSLDPFGLPDICRSPGSLEDAVGDSTIERRTGGRFTSTADLVEAVEAGDAQAGSVWSRSVRSLAAGIASLINVLDPEIVVLGGGIALAGDTLFVPLRRELDEAEWRPLGQPVPIVPAELGDYAGAIGAARHAMSIDSAVLGAEG
ncbi:MAG TPA: ROK family protein [Thermoanaerobaculia bacterium]|nr:ROK family protein [Thermoanaerobaculia bacterium]